MDKLYRSKSDSKIAGVCGGIGEMLNVDPNVIRLIMIFAAVLTVILPFIIVYFVGWLILPEGVGRNEQVKDPSNNG